MNNVVDHKNVGVVVLSSDQSDGSDRSDKSDGSDGSDGSADSSLLTC